MIAPGFNASTSRRNFYSACQFVMLLYTLFNTSLMMSLFWDVLRAVMYKRSRRVTHARNALFIIVIISSAIWAGATRDASTGLVRLVSDCLVVSWVIALIVSVIGGVFLLLVVYEEPLMTGKAMWYCAAAISLVSLLFAILSPIAYSLLDASAGAICFAVFYPCISGLLFAYCYCFRGCQKETNNFLIKASVLMLIGLSYFVIIALASNARVNCDDACQLGPVSSQKQLFVAKGLSLKADNAGYPICNKKWSSLGLQITDWAFMADLAYKTSENKTMALNRLNNYFSDRGANWELVTRSTKKPVFYHIRERTVGVNVIGIRGTKDSRDWFENCKIWNEIATFQLTSVFLPIQHLPLDFVAFFIAQSSFLDYTLHHASYNSYFKVLENYVTAVKNKSAEDVFLVGHSLGGGLAKLVGIRNRIQAISVSSPGEVYNRDKFRYSLKDVQQYTTSVIAQHDLVTWIDKHGGLVQYVECDVSSFLECHSIRNTYCELKKKCDSVTPIECP
ncbi:uncharacterized protein LOC116613925 isoform X2 [Nematostella vectensis]|nr:uncharacterized protein LOC116613925 isoform X2 [Nematostella vectensis]XP_048589422.1 uncharacterized protein LOC116613925 isoform X2 [Nematostella vectensis]